MPSAGCESGTGGGGGVDGRRRLRVAAGGVRFLGVELAGFQRRAADRCNSGRWEEPAAWEDGSARRARNGDCRNESGGPPRPLRSRLLLRDGRPATAAGRGGGAGAEAGGNEDCGCNGGDRVEFATGDGRISVSASTAAASAEAGSRDWAAAATPPLAAVGVRESVGTGWNQRWPPRRPPGTGGCSCGGMPCAFVPFSRVPSTVLDEGTQSTDRPRPAKSCNPEAQQTSSSPPPRNARDRLIRVEKKNTARRRAADDRQGVRRDSVGGEMQAVCTAVNGRVGSRRVNWVMGLGRLGLLESARQMHALHRSQDGVRSMQARSRLGRDASGRGGQRHVETT